MMARAVYSMGMKATRMTLGDGIRRAVNASGLSRYRICMDTGIDQGAFSRFMHGKVGMTLAHLEAVATYLGLVVVARGPKPKKGR